MMRFGAVVGLIAILGLIIWGLLFFVSPKNQTTTGKRSPTVSAIILPHHDLVKRQRQQFLSKIKKEAGKPKTIILVSPNHYEVGSADTQTTDRIWQISSGQISPDLTVIRALGSKTSIETGSFANEHGIKLVLLSPKPI